MMKSYEGGCHCGRVRFRIEVDLDETPIGECNCSICTKKGILHLPVSRERLQILSGADELATYQFNTGTAKHTFCRHCGIHAFYQPRSDPENYSVNARVSRRLRSGDDGAAPPVRRAQLGGGSRPPSGRMAGETVKAGQITSSRARPRTSIS